MNRSHTRAPTHALDPGRPGAPRPRPGQRHRPRPGGRVGRIGRGRPRQRGLPDMAGIAARFSPSVVNISVRGTHRVSTAPGGRRARLGVGSGRRRFDGRVPAAISAALRRPAAGAAPSGAGRRLGIHRPRGRRRPDQRARREGRGRGHRQAHRSARVLGQGAGQRRADRYRRLEDRGARAAGGRALAAARDPRRRLGHGDRLAVRLREHGDRGRRQCAASGAPRRRGRAVHPDRRGHQSRAIPAGR